MRLRFPDVNKLLEIHVTFFIFHLSKSILSYCLESLLYIDGLLGASLKIRNLILRMTPLLSTLGRDGPVIKVHLVA